MSTAHQESLYDIYLRYDLSELEQLFREAGNREELDFYSSLLTLALQKKQREVLREYPVP